MTMCRHQSQKWNWILFGGLSLVGLSATTSNAIAANPTAEKLLADYQPKQKDVEFETPSKDELAKCKVEVEKKGKSSGYVVYGSSGQVLRKLMDTDGDNQVDQWRYFKYGIEVYRDIDSNGNTKADQCRYLNLGGSRWGIDKNEDGKIDEWKVLSAAEAAREGVRALLTGDDAALQAVMINAEDLKTLGMSQAVATQIMETAADAPKKARAIMSKAKVVNAQTQWSRFEVGPPGIVPADDEKARVDLHVYENAMAIVEADKKFVGVSIGEIIRVGEVWKLTQVPQPIEATGATTASSGVLMNPPLASATAAPTAPTSPELEKILKELEEIEKGLTSPTATPASVKPLISRRGDLLKRAIEMADTADEKVILTKQLVDGYAIAAQMGTYPEGAADLKAMETDLRRRKDKSVVLPYIAYRRIQAQYYVDLIRAEQSKDKDKEKETAAEVQQEWVSSLEEFIKEFPEAEDTPEAMLLLAHHDELNARSKDALEWYARLAKEKPKTEAGQRAVGAVRRINLNGKPIELSGPGLEGGKIDAKASRAKATLVVFWSSEYKACEEDLPSLRALYKEYRPKGFEIIGVNLDQQKEVVKPFLTQNGMTWPQMHQPGGLIAPVALYYGVMSLPTMFLINDQGVVVNRQIGVQELKTSLPKLLGK